MSSLKLRSPKMNVESKRSVMSKKFRMSNGLLRNCRIVQPSAMKRGSSGERKSSTESSAYR